MPASAPPSSRIPAVGTVTQAERMFRINWVAAELRSPSGISLHSPDYASRLGHAARIVDLRTEEELVGPLGHIPGSDWIPAAEAISTLATQSPDDPILLVSRGGERAGTVAKALEDRGFRFASALMGGIVAWRQVGFATVRDSAILGRRGRLRDLGPRWVSEKRVLGRDDIARHVGDPLSIRWIKLAALLVSGRLSCVDGRDDSGVVGTPGGDAGEFLLALAALERTTQIRFDDATLRTLLLRRLDAFGNFYLHSDVQASNALIGALRADRRFDAPLKGVFEPLEWRKFLGDPPAEVQGALLEHMLVPAHVGCGHLRLSMQRAAEYGVRRELVEGFLRTFFTLRWEGVDENEVSVLPGGHAEGAVVNVLLEDEPQAFARIPLVSPNAQGSQMFINHPQVSCYLREQLVRFFGVQRDLLQLGMGGEAALTAALEEIGGAQLGVTLSALAAGLPLYDVTFGGAEARVEARGEVPAPAAAT
jgi:rhodanese-related sulfurtransferase